MKNKMNNNKNITITIAIILQLMKNLKITKIKNKKESLTTKKQMLLTLKEMTKIKSKKKMNKTMINNKVINLMHSLVSRMLLVLQMQLLRQKILKKSSKH